MAIWNPDPPVVKLPKRDSVAFKILLFIGQNRGVTTTQVQRHLVEVILCKAWDSKKRAGLWNSTLYGVGKDGLFPKYCVKFGKLWFLTEPTATALTNVAQVPIIHRRAIATLENTIPPRDLSVNNAERLPPLADQIIDPTKVTRIPMQTEAPLSPKEREVILLVTEIRRANGRLIAAQKAASSATAHLKDMENDVNKLVARLMVMTNANA